MGHGPTLQLATSLRAALAVSKTPLEKPAPLAEEPTLPKWVNAVEDSVGRKGTFKAGVLSYGVPRSQAVTLSAAKDQLGIMNGATVASTVVAESINFQEADAGNVATTGDFVLAAEEVNAVIFGIGSAPHFSHRLA